MPRSIILIRKILILLFWLILWQIFYLQVGEEILLVSPLDVFKNLYQMLFSLFFWNIICYSIGRILLGFSLSLIFGSLLAFLAYKIKILHEFLHPLIAVLKAVPVASFIILALVWIKTAQIPILISFMMVFPIVYTSIYEGLKNIEPKYKEIGKIFKLKKIEIIKYISIPSLIPYFITSLKNGIGLAWKSGIAAEIISHTKKSIGQKIYASQLYLDTLNLFTWTLVIIILSLLFEFLLLKLVDKLYSKNW